MPLDLLEEKKEGEEWIDLLAKEEPVDLLEKEPVDLLAERQEPVTPSLPDYIKFKLNSDKAGSERSRYGREAMWGRLDSQEALKKGNEARDYWMTQAGPYEDLSFKKHPFKYVAGATAQLIPYMISSQVEGLKYGLTLGGGFAAITAVAGQAGPQVALPEEVITVPFAFAAGMKTGYSYGVIKNILDREGGGLYLDLVEKGISPETAQPLALAGGVTIGVIELAQFKLLSKPFKQAFSKVIKTKVGKAAITQAISRYVKTYAGEIAQEDLQEISSLTVETIAGLIDEKPDAIPTKKEWITRILETTKAMAAGMSVITLPGAVVDITSSIKFERIAQKKEDIVLLDKIIAEAREQEKPEKEIGVKLPEGQKETELKPTPTGEDISTELEPLAIEAGKYKNAQEFAKDYEVLYHGGSENIIGNKLSLNARIVGEITPENLGKGQDYGGIFFTPEKELAQTFAGYSTTGKGTVHTFIVRKSKLFDRDNPKHRVALENFIGKEYINQDGEKEIFSKQMYDFVFPKAPDGKRYIDWATMEPNVLETLGFEGAKVVEHFESYGKGKHLYTTVLFKGGKESPHWKIEEGQSLTDFYNQATAKPAVEGKVEPLAVEPLVVKPAEKITKAEAIKPERLKPDISGISSLQRQIQSMEDRQMRVESAQGVLEEIDTVRGYFKDGLDKTALSEKELAKIPETFIAKKGGLLIPEALTELEERFGIKIDNKAEFFGYLQNLEKSGKDLLAMIKVDKPQLISRRDTALLKERIKATEQGFKEGRIQTKEEIKSIQSEAIDMIEDSSLLANDRAKFMRLVKNIQTQEQFQAAIPEILTRLQGLEIAAEKRAIEAQIAKELKYTKPTKEGQRTVGKYDYETNKFFDDIRRIAKLTQAEAQAELDAMPVEGLSQADLIKTRMLSLTANGMSGSLPLHSQVLEDIRLMKRMGAQAKSDADFTKLINRVVNIEEVSDGISKTKGDKDSVITKTENIYRLGFSNIHSMLKTIAGKDVGEKYDPEVKQNDKTIAIDTKVRETLDEIGKRLGGYNTGEVSAYFHDSLTQKFRIVDNEGLTTEVNKLEVIDIHNSIKNDLIRERYFNAFGEEQVKELLANLTSAEERVADYMQEVAQGYRNILNERNIEITGRDLGEVPYYWPATSEFEQSVFDDMRIQGETPSAMKARSTSSKVRPVPTNAWTKLMRHITQGEHVDHLSREYETLKRIFQDRKIKNQITNKFGENVYRTLLSQIDNISLNKQTERIDAVTDVMGQAINNWVVAKISLNPSVFAKQLISIVNYSEKMPTGKWALGFFKGIASPKETFKFMWENSGNFLEARFNRGFSEAMTEALKGVSGIDKFKNNWAKGLTSFVRAGDITAIIYGGHSLVQYEMSQGKSKEEAFDIFRRATLKAQQSGLSSGLSQFQNSRNPLARLFLAFKNTSNQYFRKQMDAIISYRNNEISLGELTKITTIYSVINPLLYAYVGYAVTQGWKNIGKTLFGTDDDKDDNELAMKLLIQMAINPFQAIPVLDDLSEAAARKMLGQKNYKVFSTPLFDDLETGFQKLSKKEVTLMDYFQSFGTVAEVGTGVPIQTPLRILKHLFGKGERKDKGMEKI